MGGEWQQLPSLMQSKNSSNTQTASRETSSVFDLAAAPPLSKNKEMISYLQSVSSRDTYSTMRESSGLISESNTIHNSREESQTQRTTGASDNAVKVVM
ncbi:hypothetical protein, conserved [Angomonas deanei]|uniref:Uncharacterized protein n=1 Tax=Angomonas deanei TaxID=59799 RepID=A0A7G2C471_9TRYP|nr:hypothetical protein, conserved [Angomonas deanei]